MGIQNTTSSVNINMKAFIAFSALLAVAAADVSSHATVKHGHGPVISHAVHQPHHGPAIVHAPVVAHAAPVHAVHVPVVAHPAVSTPRTCSSTISRTCSSSIPRTSSC